jgi:hypothetical protein
MLMWLAGIESRAESKTSIWTGVPASGRRIVRAAGRPEDDDERATTSGAHDDDGEFFQCGRDKIRARGGGGGARAAEPDQIESIKGRPGVDSRRRTRPDRSQSIRARAPGRKPRSQSGIINSSHLSSFSFTERAAAGSKWGKSAMPRSAGTAAV